MFCNTISHKTCTPLRYIFEHLGKQFFRSLGRIVEHDRHLRIRNAENYNVGKPPSKQRRVPYWKEPERIVNESDTVSSSDVDKSAKFFERSRKITPHALVHFTEQVIIGGTHAFNDTAANEASHPDNLKKVNLRSRKYHLADQTTRSMLKYMCERRMLQKIIAVTSLSQSG